VVCHTIDVVCIGQHQSRHCHQLINLLPQSSCDIHQVTTAVFIMTKYCDYLT